MYLVLRICNRTAALLPQPKIRIVLMSSERPSIHATATTRRPRESGEVLNPGLRDAAVRPPRNRQATEACRLSSPRRAQGHPTAIRQRNAGAHGAARYGDLILHTYHGTWYSLLTNHPRSEFGGCSLLALGPRPFSKGAPGSGLSHDEYLVYMVRRRRIPSQRERYGGRRTIPGHVC